MEGPKMEDKLWCGICKQIMEEPRILSCLHSFCTKCLIAKKSILYSDYTSRQASFQDDVPLLPYQADRRKSSFAYSTLESDAVTMPDEDIVPKIICPSCKNETLLTNGGVLNLPVNFYLQNRITAHKNQPPSCETCTSSVRAFCKCEQCDIAMCALCVDSHTKFRDTALHTLVNLSTLIAQNKPQCTSHLQELAFFCLGCTELICFTCCNTGHSGHRYESASRAADNYSAILSQALDHAKPMFAETAKGADKIRNLHSKINNRCSKVEDEINRFYEAYIEKVVAHQHDLIRELRKIKERRIALLDDCQNTLKEKLKGSSTAIEYTEELLQDSTAEELLSLAPILLNKLDASPFVASDITFVTSRVSDFLQFLPDERAPAEGQYQLFGIISTQSLSPENCTLQTEGLFSCRQHKKATFSLTTRDCENQLLLHGGEKIETELRYKDATQRVLPVTVIDGGEGSYTLSFTPDTAGSLSWSILIRGTPIQGSPFTVCVSSLRPHKGIYHCCSFCSGKGNKSVSCGCGSQMPGGYKGCGHGHEGHPGRRHWSCCGNVLQNSECGRPNSFYNF
ncbi:B-box zinc finger [Nesidiocoris tenuis]|uniref:B-box zinc finger n=1 Tax=Nesidiocoris tenuis TaxID=355587 RepID=A0ABN7A9A8_9HEMI|nr:B-box zinc finger [Nesidiocoris tenuis]